MSQYISVKQVAQAALDNWDRLGAVTGETSCYYVYDGGGCCIIGAALSPSTLSRVMDREINGEPVQALLNAGVIKGSTAYLGTLQDRHDGICNTTNKEAREEKLTGLRRVCERLAVGENPEHVLGE